MTECQWSRVNKNNLPVSSISSLLQQNAVNETQMLQHIIQDGVYGFALVDIIPIDSNKFKHLNWLPVIKHDEIRFEDLPEFIKTDDLKKTFPRKTLIQSDYAQKILLHTRLIQWYVKNGFKITKIHKVFEYQKFPCYKEVHDRVYEARVAATVEKNTKKATAIKLVSNSMYGQMIMVSLIFFFYAYILKTFI